MAEKEYVEREAAAKLLRKEAAAGSPTAYHIGLYAAARAIEAIPAADVRPVVTCADCKYNEREVTDLFGNNAIQCITGLTHRRDWFCADGKKREES